MGEFELKIKHYVFSFSHFTNDKLCQSRFYHQSIFLLFSVHIPNLE